MSYEKVVKKNGKIYGPYLYESYRDETGKVRKRCLGKVPQKKRISRANVFFAGFFLFSFLLIAFYSTDLSFNEGRIFGGFTGFVVEELVGGDELVDDEELVVDDEELVVDTEELVVDDEELVVDSDELVGGDELVDSEDEGNLTTDYTDYTDFFDGNYSFDSNESLGNDVEIGGDDELVVGGEDGGNLTTDYTDFPEGNYSFDSNESLGNESLEMVDEGELVGIGGDLVEEHLVQYKAVVGRPVRWVKLVEVAEVLDGGELVEANISVEIPEEASNISFLTGEEVDEAIEEAFEFEELVGEVSREDLVDGLVLTGNVVVDLDSSYGVVTRFWNWVAGFTISGNVVLEEDIKKNGKIRKEKGKTVVELDDFVEAGERLAVEYYTPAPEIVESDLSEGKRVVVYSEEEYNYTDILAYTLVREEFSLEEIYGRVRVNWKEEGVDVDYVAFDLDEDGLVDMLEWNVEHLSNQTYDIIYISSASHLDSNRSFLADVYLEVSERDGVGVNVSDGEYLRVSFEHMLDFSRDITIFARGNLEVGSRVEVYVEGENESVAVFEGVGEEGWYKVYLSGLEGEADVFDLRVNGSVWFDYVVDPVSSIEFVSPTPEDGAFSSEDYVEVNVTLTSSDLDEFVWDWNGTNYTIYDDSLVFRLNFDNVSALGENDTRAVDVSSYGNNATVFGGPSIVSGKHRLGMDFDNYDDSFYTGTSSSLNIQGAMTICSWINLDTIGIGNTDVLIAGTDGATNVPYLISLQSTDGSSGRINFAWINNLNEEWHGTSYGAIGVDEWQHICAVRVSDSDVDFYVNGESVATTAGDGNFAVPSVTTFVLGGGYGFGSLYTRTIDGTLDELSVWNRNLSSDEVSQVYMSSLNKYDADKWNFYVNESNLSVGDYTYQAFGLGEVGGWNSTEERSLEIVGARDVYYSVGTNASDLMIGSPTLDITSGLGIFSVSQADKVGVGDEVNYGSNLKGYISGRVNSSAYYLVDRLGNNLSDVSSATVNNITRAFNALDDAVDASDGGVCANDTDHLGSSDLVSLNVTLNIACYGDSADGLADVNGWTTGENNYVKVYTPVNSSEVGVSQRHGGAWGDGYKINDVRGVYVYDDYTRILGLQINVSSSGSYDSGINFVNVGSHAGYNIIRKTGSGTDIIGILFDELDSADSYAYNNIIYDFNNSGGDNGDYGIRATGTLVTLYNNIVVDSYRAIRAGYLSSLCKNNVVFNCTVDYFAEVDPSSVNNAFSDGVGVSGGSNSIDITGNSSSDLFVDYDNDDFRYIAGSVFVDAGVDLSSDGNLSFSDDAIGVVRPQGAAWDIGAFEYVVSPVYIEFVSPTPENDSVISRDFAYVNVSASSAENYSAWIDWNRSLVGYWSFESYNSTGVYDNSSWGGFGNFAGSLSSSDIVTGIRGNGIDFDGGTNYIDVIDDSKFDFQGKNEITLSAWGKFDSGLAWQPIVNNGPNYGKGYLLEVYVNQLRFVIDQNWTGRNLYSGSVVNDGVWHHLVAVLESNSTNSIMKIYVDGVLKNSNVLAPINITTSSNDLAIGNRQSNYPNGTIDEVMVWDRALSHEEINSSYQAGSYRLERNFTNLDSGNYTFQAYSISEDGYINSTEERVVEVLDIKDVYYSVGTNTSDLMLGSPTLDIVSGLGVFSVAQADKVGVGDRVNYDSGSVAYISGRVDSTTYYLVDNLGESIGNTASATVNNITRAFNSLAEAEAGVEALIGSDDFVYYGVSLNIPCYADGLDSTGMTISDRVTTPDNYIKIYTPVDSGEVGVSQRHNGVWDDSKFVVTYDSSDVIGIRSNNVIIEGLQIYSERTNEPDRCIELESLGPQNATIRDNIIVSTSVANGILFNDASSTANIYNNIIYANGSQGASSEGIYCLQCGDVNIFNNIVANYNDGIEVDSGGVVNVSNCVVFDNADDFDGVINVYYSASDDGDGASSVVLNASRDFVDASGYDFNLKVGSFLIDNGTAVDSFSDDIVGTLRPQGSAWDIGAFEYFEPEATPCYNCSDCNSKLSSAGAGEVVALANNISINDSTCITFPDDDVILDCDGYTISGNNYTSTYGVLANGRDNVTLRDCVVRDFDDAIYFTGTDNSLIFNNSGYSAVGYGIIISGSSNNTLTLNNGTSVDDHAIYIFTNSNYNNLSHNIGTSVDGYGITLYQSDYNNLTFNSGISSSDRGMSIYQSDYNYFASNVFRSDANYGANVDASNYNDFVLNNASSLDSVGFYLSSSVRNNLISNIGASNISYGIRLNSATNNTLISNIGLSNFSNGIDLYSGANYNNLTSNNGTSNNNGRGICLTGSLYNDLTYNTGASVSHAGIALEYSSNNNTLSFNNGTSNSYSGIHFYQSSGNLLTSNIGASQTNGNGIYFYSSSENNTLISNVGISDSLAGINFYSSNGNTLILNNGTSNTNFGIQVRTSHYTNATSNIGTSSSNYGFEIYDSDYSNFTSNLGESTSGVGFNIGNGAAYNNFVLNNGTSGSFYGLSSWYGDNNTFESCVGYSSSNTGINFQYSDGNNLTSVVGESGGNGRGIFIYRSNYNLFNLSNGTSSANGDGVLIEESFYNNIVSSNGFSDSNTGIELYLSDYNNLTSCFGNSSDADGIYVRYSDGNIFTLSNGTSYGWTGFSVAYSNYNTLFSNIGKSYSYMGLISHNSNFNNFTSNIGISTSQKGFMIENSSYSNFTSNNGTSGVNTGIDIYSNSNFNNFISNVGYSSSNTGIYLHVAYNNTFNSNVGSSFSWSGFGVGSAKNNSFTDDIAFSEHYVGLGLNDADNNYFYGLNASSGDSSDPGISIYNSSGNDFEDCVYVNGNNDVYVATDDSREKINTFLNCSYDSESVTDADSSLVREWWFGAYVNDSVGGDVSGANVTAYNVSDSAYFSVLTNSSGEIEKVGIAEYARTSSGVSYYNNYTIEAFTGGGIGNLLDYNVSEVLNKVDNVITIEVPYPNITSVSDFNRSYIEDGNVVFEDDVTINVTLDTNAGVDSVWVKVWVSSIGGAVFGVWELVLDALSGIWSVTFGADSSLGVGDVNYTVFVNNTLGEEVNESGSFFVNFSSLCGSSITSDLTLDSDLYCEDVTALTFGADDVTLDCAGHTIRGNNYTGTYGVLASLRDNVTLRNCIVRDFDDAIYFYAVHNSTIYNNSGYDYNSGHAIYLYTSTKNNLTSNTGVSSGGHGIYLYSSSNDNSLISNFGSSVSYNGILLHINSNNNTLFLNNGTSESDAGISLYIANYNNLTMNIGTSNSSKGIQVYTSSNNTFTSNVGSSESNDGIYVYWYSRLNNFTSNVGASNGNGIGLNVHSYSDYNNFILNNASSAGIGVAISVYGSENNNFVSCIGNSNLSYGLHFSSANNNTITSCLGNSSSDIGIYFSDGSSYNLLNLSNGSSISSNGIDFYASPYNTILSSFGSTNSGQGMRFSSGSDYNVINYSNGTSDTNVGINLYLVYNNSFNSCIGTSLANDHGFSLFAAHYNNFTSSKGSSSGGRGFSIAGASTNNRFVSNIGSSDTGIGINLDSSSNYNNLVLNNGTSNSSYGIFISGSSYNTLTSNIGASDSATGIQLHTSSNNNTLLSNNGTSVDGIGINLFSSSNNNLTSNIGNSNSSSGISISSSTYNYLVSNLGNSSTSYGIYFDAGAHGNFLNFTNGSSDTNVGIFVFGYDNDFYSCNGFSNSQTGLLLHQNSHDNFLNLTNGTSGISAGIGMYRSYDNELYSCYAKSTSGNAFDINEINGNNFTNLRTHSVTGRGSRIEGPSSNNRFYGMVSYSENYQGTAIFDSDNNYFYNLNSSCGDSSDAGIYLYNSSGNDFEDCSHVSGNNGVYVATGDARAKVNTFLNCSYDSETVTSASDVLVREWWFGVYVNDSLGSDVSGANVTAYNVSDSAYFSVLTNASGEIDRIGIAEYRNIGGTVYYENNYSVEAVSGGGIGSLEDYNVSLYLNKVDNVITMNFAPLIDFVSPTPENGSSVYVDYVEVNSSINASLDELIWNWNGTNYTLFNDSLVLMYNFDNVSALGENDSVVVDVSGNGNDGAVLGATWNSSGKYGGAYEFGVNNVRVATEAIDFSNTNEITVSVWVRPDSSPSANRMIIELSENMNNENSAFFINYNATGYSQGGLEGNNGYNTWDMNTTLDVGEWNHLIYVFDKGLSSGEVKGYLNGVLNGRTVYNSDNTNNFGDHSIYIGIRELLNVEEFDGAIDEVRVWNRSLSVAEIEQVYMSNLRKYDIDKWNFYVNESNLSAGDYTYQAFAGDGLFWNSTEERSVTVANTNTYFKSTWNTSKVSAGSSNSTSIALPLESDGTYDFTVYWGDGTNGSVTSWDDEDANHTYSSEGVYDIWIDGEIVGFQFDDTGDKLKILDISQWGNLRVGNNQGYFEGCSNLDVSATDALNLTGTDRFNNMFEDCINFNGDIDNWDVSDAYTLSYMFRNATSFNRDLNSWNFDSVISATYMFNGATSFDGNISLWNMSSVENIYGMFWNAESFTGDLSLWDTSNVANIDILFRGATDFNGDITTWNTSGIDSMDYVFLYADSFDQDISGWDTSGVTSMISCFGYVDLFNQDVSAWDVSNVENMNTMFRGAVSFDQDLGAWNVSSLTSAVGMFDQIALSVENYDSILINWSQLNLQNDTVFSGGNSEYCLGEDARQSIIDDYNWSITDAGINCPYPSISALVDFNESYVVDGNVAFGNNVSFNVTLGGNYGIDKVLVKVWDGGIGGDTVGSWEFSLDSSSGVWVSSFEVNSSFNLGGNNYTVFVNNSEGEEVNSSGNFTVVVGEVGSCGNLDVEDGVYVLNDNVSSSGTCFDVSANNVTLDCAGYTINYSSGEVGYGVYAHDVSDFSLRNCEILQTNGSNTYSYGVYFSNADDALIYNNSIETYPDGTLNVYSSAVRLEESSGGNISNNNVSVYGRYNYGFDLRSNSDSNLIAYNNFYSNTPSTRAVYLLSSDSVEVRNNDITDLSYSSEPFYLQSSSYATIVDNVVDVGSSYALYVNGGSTTSYYNHTIENNTNEGKKLLYYFAQDDLIVEDNNNISQLWVTESDNVTIENLTMVDQGIYVFRCDNAKVLNNYVSTKATQRNALYIYRSNNANVSNNYLQVTSWTDILRFDYSDFAYVDNNTMLSTSTNVDSLYMLSSDDSIFENNNFSALSATVSYGVSLQSSNNNTFRDSVISSPTSDVWIRDAGVNYFVNVSFNESDFTFYAGATGSVKVGWWVDGNVVDHLDAPVLGADVYAEDSFTSEAFNVSSDSNGDIERQVLYEFSRALSGLTNYNNYTVNASKSGYEVDSKNLNVSDNLDLSFVLNGNVAPNNVTPVLVSVDSLNLTSSDLNCSAFISDADGDSLNVTVRWYKDGGLNLTVDYDNDYSNATEFYAVLDSGNTSKGEVWFCSVRVYDGELYSSWGNSSDLTVLNSLPSVSLISPVDWSSGINRSLEFSWSGSDADSDNLTYEILIEENQFAMLGPSCNEYINDDTLEVENYVPATDLSCLYDNGFYYNWSVRASDDDGVTWGDWSSEWHFNVTAEININLASSEIVFASMSPGDVEDTTDDSPGPFVLDNDGNVLTNVSVNSSSLWEMESSTSSYYQFKVDNVTGEEGAFNWLLSYIDWGNVPITGSVVGIGEFDYQDGLDSCEVDIRLETPAGEAPGVKNASIVFRGDLAE